MLESHSQGLYTVDHSLRVQGAEFGTRTTVIRLSSGNVLLIAPGPLSAADLASVRDLGDVAAVVAPNRFHFLFVAQTLESFPQAALFTAPGLAEKAPALPASEVLQDSAPALWKDSLDQHHVEASGFVNEVVFFHRASRSLILTDLAFNFTDSPNAWTTLVRLAFGVHQRFAPSRLIRFLLRRDRRRLQASAERILSWDFERIVLTHGNIVHRDGRARLATMLQAL